MERLWRWIESIGEDPTDGIETRSRKRVLVVVSVVVAFLAIFWGAVYFALGEPGAALIPWTYTVACPLGSSSGCANRSPKPQTSGCRAPHRAPSRSRTRIQPQVGPLTSGFDGMHRTSRCFPTPKTQETPTVTSPRCPVHPGHEPVLLARLLVDQQLAGGATTSHRRRHRRLASPRGARGTPRQLRDARRRRRGDTGDAHTTRAMISSARSRQPNHEGNMRLFLVGPLTECAPDRERPREDSNLRHQV